MDTSRIILDEMINEIGLVGGGAAAGAGIGAASGAIKWAKDRLNLRNQMKSCGDNPSCKEAMKDKISQLNKRALTGTVKRAVVGAGVGAAAGGLGKAAGLQGVATRAKNIAQVGMKQGKGAGEILSNVKQYSGITPAIQNAPSTLLKNIQSTYGKAAQAVNKYSPFVKKPTLPPSTNGLAEASSAGASVPKPFV